MADSFYVPLGDGRRQATVHPTGPWDARAQHAGPPSALLGRAMPGPASVWGRMRFPLLPDEEPSPLERVLVIADSGNGASWELDINRWHFINPELTVHLHREAAGEWVCLDAQTAIYPGRRRPRHLRALRPHRPGRRRRPVLARRAPAARRRVAPPGPLP